MKTKRFLIVAEVEYVYNPDADREAFLVHADDLRWELISRFEGMGFDINSVKVVEDRENL
jgi:predicted ATPase